MPSEQVSTASLQSARSEADPACEHCTEVPNMTPEDKICLRCLYCRKEFAGGGIHNPQEVSSSLVQNSRESQLNVQFPNMPQIGKRKAAGDINNYFAPKRTPEAQLGIQSELASKEKNFSLEQT